MRVPRESEGKMFNDDDDEYEALCPFCDDWTDHVESGDERTCTNCGKCVAHLDYIGERYVWVHHQESSASL
jgi:hypothetical protein